MFQKNINQNTGLNKFKVSYFLNKNDLKFLIFQKYKKKMTKCKDCNKSASFAKVRKAS